MSQTYKTEAIILSRQDYKDRDRTYRIVTPHHGTLLTRAISARKLQSKLAGSIEPFMYAELFVAKSKSLDIIAGSSPLASNPRLRQSPQHNAVASLFAEIVSRAIDGGTSDPAAFDHVAHTLVWCNDNPANLLVVYGASLQLFGLLGYPIDLYRCHSCRRSISASPNAGPAVKHIKFVLQLWNVECNDCSSIEQTVLLPLGVIKTARYIFEQDYDSTAKLGLDPVTWQQLHVCIQQLLHYHFAGSLISAESVFAVLQAPARTV